MGAEKRGGCVRDNEVLQQSLIPFHISTFHTCGGCSHEMSPVKHATVFGSSSKLLRSNASGDCDKRNG